MQTWYRDFPFFQDFNPTIFFHPPYVIGRKNWLFCGSEQAAKYSSVILTLLSRARRHGLNEWEYLVDVLYRLSDSNPETDTLENLLPDRWVRSTAPPTEAALLVSAR